MIDESEFQELSKSLIELSNDPVDWNIIQNNYYDFKLLKGRFYSLNTYNDLLNAISSLQPDVQAYFKKRWYVWKCSVCDEYLFYKNQNIIKNPNERDPNWDIEINGNVRFDVKGTRLPKHYIETKSIKPILQDSSDLVKWYYKNQSQGSRLRYQNRLFIVHHSYIDTSREFQLRCSWDIKERAFKTYAERFDQVKLTECDFLNKENNTPNVLASVIFIIEKPNGEMMFCF